MEDFLKRYCETVRQLLEARHEKECLEVFDINLVEIDCYNHDNWNGGIDFYEVRMPVYPSRYQELKDERLLEHIEKTLAETFKESIPTESVVVDVFRIYPDASLEYEERQQRTSNNKIPFYLYHIANPYQRDAPNTIPRTVPSFMLLSNTWDDFGVKTRYGLNYYDEEKKCHHIGYVKIIKYEYSDPDRLITREELSNSFTDIGDDYCSLGQEVSYYDNMKSLFPETYRDILLCLRDCAIFPDIEPLFRGTNQFRSLIRTNDAERILREEKFRITGQDIKTRYVFDYIFKPKYADETIKIPLYFSQTGYRPNRIYAIIGENGVGKTQFISTLPMAIYKKDKDCFYPHIPIFSKIIAISNCPYDSFEIPVSNQEFGYVYCGISKKKHGVKTIITDQELKHGLFNALRFIRARGVKMISKIRKILSNLFTDEELAMLFTGDEKGLSIRLDRIDELCDRLSSGQNAMLYQFCNVVAHIRLDSIILFDEPETHMHPNAITMIMAALHQLLEEFESYCIIVTHSPLVIREVMSDCVYVMTREQNHADINKIGIETFGADTSVIIDEVFGNKETKMPYKLKVQEMAQNMSYEDIVKELESDNVPLSLHLLLYVKAITTKVMG